MSRCNMGSRPLRIGEQLCRELAAMLRREVKDPRISKIIIYEVVVTKNLGFARVYFNFLDRQQDLEKTMQGLESAKGFFHAQLGRKLHLRKIPELCFIFDDTEAKSARIEQLIRQNLTK